MNHVSRTYGNNRFLCLRCAIRFITWHTSLQRPIVAPDVCSLEVEEGDSNDALPPIFMNCPTVCVELHSKHQRRQRRVSCKGYWCTE